MTVKRIYSRDISLRIPQLAAAKVAHNAVEFHLPSLHRSTIGPIQTFGLKHIRTGFGKNSFGGIRHAFICDCGRPVTKLYVLNRWIACQRCHNAIHASQAVNQQQRPVLQASRIASFLDNKSKLYHRTRERLRKRLGDKVMMAQGRRTRNMGAPALGITTRNTRSIEHRRVIGPSLFAHFIGPCALGFLALILFG